MRSQPGCSGRNSRGVCLFFEWPDFYDRYPNHRFSRHAMITTLTSAPASAILEPGQSLRTAVDAGTWLQVAEGRVRVVSPPGWFGETVFTAQAVLNEGDVHHLAHGGWIEVSALATAHLRIHAPAAGLVSGPEQGRPVMRFVRLLTGW
jgi:hypothetical protein